MMGEVMPDLDKGWVVLISAVWAVAVWLGGCAPAEQAMHEPVVVPSPPVAVEKAAGPIVLAPELTGHPPPPPKPPRAAAPTVPPPSPAPPPVIAAPPPPAVRASPAAAPIEPPAATALPEAAPPQCPPGMIGRWSPPDSAGVPVFICRRGAPLR
jgi:hypothetical protein